MDFRKYYGGVLLMKFKNWTIDSLINYLKEMKLSPDFDWRYVTRVSGEIELYNAEPKKPKYANDDVIYFE